MLTGFFGKKNPPPIPGAGTPALDLPMASGNSLGEENTSLTTITASPKRSTMTTLKPNFSILVVLAVEIAVGTLSGCSWMNPKSPDVADNIRKSLDQTGLKDVTISQDRDKGIVTLGGSVKTAQDKVQAETIAKGIAASQVIADEIAVLPVGGESAAKTVNSDLDTGIEKNLDAVLILNKLHDHVKYSVKTGVVTLTGNVDSRQTRSQAEQLASAVPNVTQVVNDLQTRDQKATSSN
jgi:osmotically-inducible protein OsmY